MQRLLAFAFFIRPHTKHTQLNEKVIIDTYCELLSRNGNGTNKQTRFRT